MKKIFLLKGILFLFLFTLNACAKESSCSNNKKDGTETGIDCGGDCSPCNTTDSSIKIDNMLATISETTAQLNNNFYTSHDSVPINGLKLSIKHTLSTGTIVGIVYYNDDVSANCLNEGSYVTNLGNATTISPFKYGIAYVQNATDYHVTEGKTTDNLNLTLCDASNKKLSGNYDLIVQSNAGVEISIAGSFKDISYTKLY